MEALFKEYQDKLPLSILDEVRENVPEKIDKAKLKKILELIYEDFIKTQVDAEL